MPDFEEIYQTYFADVYRYILALSRDAHTAEEVTQETFFRALASIDQFRGDCQLRVWLYNSSGIARRLRGAAHHQDSRLGQIVVMAFEFEAVNADETARGAF